MTLLIKELEDTKKYLKQYLDAMLCLELNHRRLVQILNNNKDKIFNEELAKLLSFDRDICPFDSCFEEWHGMVNNWVKSSCLKIDEKIEELSKKIAEINETENQK